MTSYKKIADIVGYLSSKWSLTNLAQLTKSTCTNNYVAVGYSANYKRRVVLKISFVDTNELQALQYFNDHACVTLLDWDEVHNAFLLEYVQPGVTLKTFFPSHDKRSIVIAADLIKRLHVKVASPNEAERFKTVAQWLHVLEQYATKKIPEPVLQRARHLSKLLVQSQGDLYVLHGDLHQENILQNGDIWITIDPKGVIGELSYEVGRFIMNPKPELLEQVDASKIIKSRIETFSTIFGFEKQQVANWCFVQAVLFACWAEQDKSKDIDYFVKFAGLVE